MSTSSSPSSSSTNSGNNNNNHNHNSNNNNENFLKIAYFASIAGVSILVGFSTTLSRLRKDPPGPPTLHDEGVALARKALGRATLYSVCGFSVFALLSYNLFGRELIERKALEYRAARERESDLPSEIKDYFISDRQRAAREAAAEAGQNLESDG